MKRILSLILTFVLLLSFTACSGNFAQVDLKEPIALADDGIVERDVFEKIKNENAIATFTGESSGIMIAAEPMLEKMDRIKVKYGLVE